MNEYCCYNSHSVEYPNEGAEEAVASMKKDVLLFVANVFYRFFTMNF